MVMHKTLVAIAAITALLPFGAALADDLPPITAPSWTGIYVGGHAGYASSDTHWTHESISPYSAFCAFCAITLPGEKFSADGAIAGGQIGYNFQFGSWVISPEFSYSGTGLRDEHPISSGAFNTPGSTTLDSNISQILTVTGRLGYAINDSFLVYAKGGFANARLSAEGSDTSFLNYSYATDKRTDGWTAGGGIEYRLSNNISVAVEYAHLDFGDQTLVGNIATLPEFPDKLKVNSDADTVTARLNLLLMK
jgi:outer membrane immunogenic protein